MSNIISLVEKNLLQARKEKASGTASLLSLLLNDMRMIGKNDGGRATTEDEALAVVKKHIKGVADCLSVNLTKLQKVEYEFQFELLMNYLPYQLSETQISAIINALISDTQDIQMKDIMAHFKEKYPGQYDGKFVSTLTRNFLAKATV